MKEKGLTISRDSLDKLGVKDANEGIFIQKELTHLESKLYETKKRKIKARQFIPVSNEGGPGLQNINYEMMTSMGASKIINAYSTDIPEADVFTEEFTSKVFINAIKVSYTTQQIRSAARTRKSLDGLKMSAARRAIEEKVNNIAWTGDDDHNIIGVLHHPNIGTTAAPNNAGSTSTNWADKVAAEILKDVTTLVSAIKTGSKEVHTGNVLLIPTAQHLILGTITTGTSSDQTLIDFILSNSAFGIQVIDTLNTELTDAFTSGTEDGAFLYEMDSDNFTLVIPMEMVAHSPQATDLKMVIPIEQEIVGVVMRYPLAFHIMTGI